MQVIAWEFKDGARWQKGAKPDPTIVGEHIDLLKRQQKGELTPDDLLADAKNLNSPLHPLFEWTDSEAARLWRLEQARGIIRSVIAVYKDGDDKPVRRVQAYVHVPEPSVPHYRATHEAMGLTKTRDLVLQRAWRDLRAWKARYRDLDEFAALFEVVDQLEGQMPGDEPG